MWASFTNWYDCLNCFVGVFIHELLVGKPPFRGKDYIKTYNLILRGIDSIQLSNKVNFRAFKFQIQSNFMRGRVFLEDLNWNFPLCVGWCCNTFIRIHLFIKLTIFDSQIPKKAQLIIKRLCRKDPAERLGCQKNGINDIREHSWYADFDWEKLRTRKLTAPLKRPVKNNRDLSNFDEYPIKDRDDPPDETSGWDDDF